MQLAMYYKKCSFFCRAIHPSHQRRRSRGRDGGQHAGRRLHAGQPQEHGAGHGRRDREAEQAVRQDQQQGMIIEVTLI